LWCCLFTTQPSTRLADCARCAFACLRFFLLALVMSTTMSTPSTLGARMFASDRPSRGGVSKMITSAPQLANAVKKCAIAFESSSSAGFGGNGPVGMTIKFGMPTSCTYELREKLAGSTLLMEGSVLNCHIGNVEVANCRLA